MLALVSTAFGFLKGLLDLFRKSRDQKIIEKAHDYERLKKHAERLEQTISIMHSTDGDDYQRRVYAEDFDES